MEPAEHYLAESAMIRKPRIRKAKEVTVIANAVPAHRFSRMKSNVCKKMRPRVRWLRKNKINREMRRDR